jgi:hypothetical protein
MLESELVRGSPARTGGDRVLRVDYNTVRPHSSLGYRTPEEFAAANGCRKDGGFATLENASRFPLSPSRDDGGTISTVVMEPKTLGAPL